MIQVYILVIMTTTVNKVKTNEKKYMKITWNISLYSKIFLTKIPMKNKINQLIIPLNN